MGAEIADTGEAMGRHVVDGVQPSVFLRLDSLWTVNAEKALEKHGTKPRCVGRNVLTTRLHIGQNVLQSRAKIGQNVTNLDGRGYRESPGNVGHSERCPGLRDSSVQLYPQPTRARSK